MAENGQSVMVDAPGGERPATVVPMPFIDPMKEIPKASAGKAP